ncbi:MAG: YraN family protein [Gemmataceae bacterium]
MSAGGLTRWPMWRRLFGDKAERAAASFLRKAGCRILARNVRLPGGELDIIALDRDILVFAEVRSTECSDVSRPAESVDIVKQKKLTELALAYLQKHRLLGRMCRFDVLAVSWPAKCKVPVIEHYANAFEATGRFQMFT